MFPIIVIVVRVISSVETFVLILIVITILSIIVIFISSTVIFVIWTIIIFVVIIKLQYHRIDDITWYLSYYRSVSQHDYHIYQYTDNHCNQKFNRATVAAVEVIITTEMFIKISRHV